MFDQLDIIAALAPGHYLTGPYASIEQNGLAGGGSLGDVELARIPEPATLLLLTLGVLGVLIARQREAS
jgi:hypothetical protein